MMKICCTSGKARFAALLCTALALGGCQRDAARAAQEAETEVFARADPLPQFTLEPISLYEQEDFVLDGDKRCAFSTRPGLPPLLVATGFLRQPQRQVDVLTKYGGQVIEGRLDTPGGFDAILHEATFETSGMKLDVAQVTARPDGSGPAAPGQARLRVTMAGQDQQIIEGYWLCTV